MDYARQEGAGVGAGEYQKESMQWILKRDPHDGYHLISGLLCPLLLRRLLISRRSHSH
jgi:hypothetical protein